MITVQLRAFDSLRGDTSDTVFVVNGAALGSLFRSLLPKGSLKEWRPVFRSATGRRFEAHELVFRLTVGGSLGRVKGELATGEGS